MKTRVILILSFLLFFFSLQVMAVEDDCPCRKKVAPKVKVEPKKKVVKQVIVQKSLLFQSTNIPDEKLCKGTIRQRINLNVKIMPNPVNSYLNIIYDTKDGQNVKIELLSCQGKLIKVLMNKVVYGEGLKENTFNINGQVSRGDAYIRLTSGVITKLEKIFIM
ncbi:MAG: hypothetical protein M0P47_02130 [Bacteroidales bacterium]|nr:hypothetical protein [Bacteroidales bacterium]